jgi:hypothetical protein
LCCGYFSVLYEVSTSNLSARSWMQNKNVWLLNCIICQVQNDTQKKITNFHEFQIDQSIKSPAIRESFDNIPYFNWLIDLRSSGFTRGITDDVQEVKRINCGNDTNNHRLSNRYLDFLHLFTCRSTRRSSLRSPKKSQEV